MMKKTSSLWIIGVYAVGMLAGGQTQASQDLWLAVADSGCKVWSEEAMKPGEVVRWSGDCENDRLSGKGILEVVAAGQRQIYFEGTMRGGKAHGEGVVERHDADGKTRYSGGFAEGLFEGFGLLELADGTRYEGGFRADKPDGYGLYQGADGSRYQGDLSAGAPDGEGFEISADGAAYHGGFKSGEHHGQGTLLFADGGLYEGGFENGKANGSGVFTDLSGTTVTGTWSAGKANGEFVVTRADGTVERQVWRDDQQVAANANGGSK